jgi:hypothetical protein
MFEGNIIVCDEPERIKERVEGELLELWPERLWEAISVVERMPGVLEVQTYGGQLRVFVDDAARRAPALQGALTGAGIPIRSLRQTRPRMEEAFISLISKQSEK